MIQKLNSNLYTHLVNRAEQWKQISVFISWSETSLEAGQLQLVDGSLVGERGSGDSTGRTSFFTQPHLPVDDTDRKT